MFTIGSERVALVTDTACDLLDEQLERYDIRLVSLRVVTSQGEFRDRVEIDSEQVYQILQTELPKTSLPLPEDVTALYRQLQAEGATRILHICMSGNLSGTYNMVSILADETEALHVDVVDAQTLSCGTGLLVLEAAECLERGMAVEDVIARLQELRRHQLGAFVIRTLEFLRKGGRIGLVEGV
ncbi:MAG: DegV family protein, partial [Aristaeellaceae bacterium]